ncbi:hypothetical protein FRUB_01774 [Fimbriiglobus ruber]|uniref:Uncharacterized protein n=1 Tax=Fimbriiglobus ruber TaxID=1908690 RepID=A0A225DWQ1_9BACT|nr:hypothetical protein FRUB_01774 [Fimbriiglobus ruber]
MERVDRDLGTAIQASPVWRANDDLLQSILRDRVATPVAPIPA